MTILDEFSGLSVSGARKTQLRHIKAGRCKYGCKDVVVRWKMCQICYVAMQTGRGRKV